MRVAIPFSSFPRARASSWGKWGVEANRQPGTRKPRRGTKACFSPPFCRAKLFNLREWGWLSGCWSDHRHCALVAPMSKNPHDVPTGECLVTLHEEEIRNMEKGRWRKPWRAPQLLSSSPSTRYGVRKTSLRVTIPNVNWV